MENEILNGLKKVWEVFWDFITYVISIFGNIIKSITGFLTNAWSKVDNTPSIKEPGIIPKGNNHIILLVMVVSLVLMISYFFSIFQKYKNEK